ncbi:hypothetical protein QCM80_42705 [Bradyrhizobium sp. SSUT112]|uniref:hypothetical protein n=1 Tax=Bradyrhizobium sp. SSUT112 TaxID=3040604 RepID=UPI00244B8F8E|nr:hypothetical protein [Bradyrhizobium sp. SSUT112]MDH2357233.1 hypothetical protein [Bradyrhizobium sp. SSUT112]
MANGVEDLQILRLIKAFQKLTDQDTRRMVLRYIEEQVEETAKPNSPPGATGSIIPNYREPEDIHSSNLILLSI